MSSDPKATPRLRNGDSCRQRKRLPRRRAAAGRLASHRRPRWCPRSPPARSRRQCNFTGLVGNLRTFTLEDLKALPADTVQVSYAAGQGTESGTFTGTRLLNVFDAAGGARLPNDMNNAKLRTTVMVTAADGYQVAFGWGELDPDFGAAPILLAYARDGQPMGDKQGMARIVVPGDKRGGRYASMVKSIELRSRPCATVSFPPQRRLAYAVRQRNLLGLRSST
jgi:hypothetical protein